MCFVSVDLRLDAGTFGTMGVGLGFAIAASLWCRDHAPNKQVVCVQGDSAFGFAGMEVETMMRWSIFLWKLNLRDFDTGWHLPSWSVKKFHCMLSFSQAQSADHSNHPEQQRYWHRRRLWHIPKRRGPSNWVSEFITGSRSPWRQGWSIVLWAPRTLAGSVGPPQAWVDLAPGILGVGVQR